MNIDYRSIVIFLHKKGIHPIEIKYQIDSVFGRNSYSYSAITHTIRNLSFFTNFNDHEKNEEKNINEERIKLIEETLIDFPFLSLKQIAMKTNIPKTTVFRILTQDLHYASKHLKWIPYELKSSQKVMRINLSNQLLKILQEEKKTNYNFIITGDESWFYLSSDYERQWIPFDQKPSKRARKMIGSKKFMFTIFWNPNGFLIVKVLPKDVTFNEDYFINEILEPINKLTASMRNQTGKKLILHYDNARPHTSKKVLEYLESHNMYRAPHPPFSPDIAPSDFFLIGYIKNLLIGKSFRSPEQLLSAINEILRDIQKKMLMDAFSEWEKRLSYLTSSDGDYIES